MISPLRFDPGFNLDIAVIAGGTLLLLLAMFTGQKQRIDRWEAFVLLLAYLFYFYYLVT